MSPAKRKSLVQRAKAKRYNIKTRSYWDSNPSPRKDTDEGIRIRCDDHLHYRTLCMNCVGTWCGGPKKENSYSKWACKISLRTICLDGVQYFRIHSALLKGKTAHVLVLGDVDKEQGGRYTLHKHGFPGL